MYKNLLVIQFKGNLMGGINYLVLNIRFGIMVNVVFVLVYIDGIFVDIFFFGCIEC